MEILFATIDEMQKDFEKYLDLVSEEKQVVITKNGKAIGRFIGSDTAAMSLSRSLRGFVNNKYNLEDEKTKYMKKKYKVAD